MTIRVSRTLECDRCHRLTDLSEVTEATENSLEVIEEGKKHEVNIDTTIAGVAVKIRHLCDSCKARVANLAQEMIGNYELVKPSRPRKKKEEVQPGDAAVSAPAGSVELGVEQHGQQSLI